MPASNVRRRVLWRRSLHAWGWRLTTSASLLLAVACAGPPRVTLPAGNGTPFPGFASAYAESTAECRTVNTMSASLSLSGRAGGTRLSARIDAGFADGGRLRLEGYPRVSFGGKPFFVLVSRGGDATLVLTRDARVLTGTAPAAIIEALTGIALDPDRLRGVVSGCGLAAMDPTAGHSFDNGWASVDAGDTTVFLRQLEGRWRVVAARRESLTVEYRDFDAAPPHHRRRGRRSRRSDAAALAGGGQHDARGRRVLRRGSTRRRPDYLG